MTTHTTDKRIRGRKLQEIRRRHFAIDPLCVMCREQGRVRLATQLDHIQALVNQGTDTPDNRQGLCDPCHALKTAQDLGFQRKPKLRFDIRGNPVGD